jgi:hypothetical protein
MSMFAVRSRPDCSPTPASTTEVEGSNEPSSSQGITSSRGATDAFYVVVLLSGLYPIAA